MLFRGIVSRKAERLRESGGLTYSWMSELLKVKLQQLGFSIEDYSLHSLRAGGVTTTTAADIPNRVFKCHGRWKSENAKDDYVVDRFYKV